MKEDLEKPVNKFKTTILTLLLALPLFAQVENEVVSQTDTTSYVVTDTVPSEQPLPVIEYTLQPKTYEIADIKVTGADSYEDFYHAIVDYQHRERRFGKTSEQI